MMRKAYKTFLLIAAVVVLILVTIANRHWTPAFQPFRHVPGRLEGTHQAAYSISFQPNWKVRDAEAFTAQQVIDYFYWTNRSSCLLAHDFGGKMVHNPVSGLDGQKAVCLDPEVAPKPGKDCLVYSFGINNEWSFDDLMEDYGCEVFAFDPSLGLKDHNRTAKIHFYSWGLADKDYVNEENQWTMKSLSTIYRELGHEGRIIDYLKMDIEGAEWAVLPQILSSGMLPKVRQLGVEFHLNSEEKTLEDFIRSHVIPVKALEDAGMVRFDSKANIFWTRRIPVLNFVGPVGFEIAWYQRLPYSS